MLDQEKAEIQSFAGDGAFDTRKVYDKCLKKGIENILIPPKKNARIWQHGNCDAPPHPRDENLRQIRATSRKEWKEAMGYHIRSLSETAMFRFKTIFGDRLDARNFNQQRTEFLIKAPILNKMMKLGMPDSLCGWISRKIQDEFCFKNIRATKPIKAINITAKDPSLDIKNNCGVELDPALLLSIIACCYKDGRKTGDIAFRKISDVDIGKEIKIFDHHGAGEGNRFIALWNMEIRRQQVMPGFPVKVFGTIREVPSVLLFFRYFGAFNDPAYDMRENETISLSLINLK